MKKLIIIIVLSLLAIPVFAREEQEIFIIDDIQTSSFYYCSMQTMCDSADSTEVEEEEFNHYVAFTLLPGGFGWCTEKVPITLEILIDSVYEKVTDLTPIKVIGGNPISIVGQASLSCNINVDPRGLFILEPNINTCGNTYRLKSSGCMKDLSCEHTYRDIIVADCEEEASYEITTSTPETIIISSWDETNEILYTDVSLLFWFLGGKIVLTSLLIFLW